MRSASDIFGAPVLDRKGETLDWVSCHESSLLLLRLINPAGPFKDIESDDVESSEIPTLIRFFNEGNRSEICQPNAFVYSSGTFLTTSSEDEDFHIVLHAHNLDRSANMSPINESPLLIAVQSSG